MISNDSRRFVIICGVLWGAAVLIEWISVAAGPPHFYRDWEAAFNDRTGFFKPNFRYDGLSYGELTHLSGVS